MAARAIWKGILKVGDSDLPIKLYSAVQDRTVHFHILEKQAHTRVKQRLVESETGKEVETADIQRAYEVQPGVFVPVPKETLQSFEPPASRDIQFNCFVPPEAIHHVWYERPYYLGPDGDAEGYFALAAALAQRKREGICHWAMRKKNYLGALRAQDGYLALFTLRYVEEVIAAKDLPKPQGPALDKRELDMARQLITMLEGEFHAEEFHDEYRRRVEEFLEAKAAGKKPKLQTIRPKQEPDSLLSALKASLDAGKKGQKVA